jgi:hypothetical protein
VLGRELGRLAENLRAVPTLAQLDTSLIALRDYLKNIQ